MRKTALALTIATAATLGCSDALGPDGLQIANVLWLDGIVYLPVHNLADVAPGTLLGHVELTLGPDCRPDGDVYPWAGDDIDCDLPDPMPHIFSNSLPVGTPVHAAEGELSENMVMVLDGERPLALARTDITPVTGEIVARDVAMGIAVAEGLPNIQVRPEGDACDIIFAIAPETALLHADGLPASVEDLTVGEGVEIWTPAIAESCPAQSIAHLVKLASPAGG